MWNRRRRLLGPAPPLRRRVLHARHRWVHFAVTTTQAIPITFAARALHVVVVSAFLQEVRFVDAVDRTTVLLVRPVVATLVVLSCHFVLAMRIRALAPATLILNRELHSHVVQRLRRIAVRMRWRQPFLIWARAPQLLIRQRAYSLELWSVAWLWWEQLLVDSCTRKGARSRTDNKLSPSLRQEPFK